MGTRSTRRRVSGRRSGRIVSIDRRLGLAGRTILKGRLRSHPGVAQRHPVGMSTLVVRATRYGAPSRSRGMILAAAA